MRLIARYFFTLTLLACCIPALSYTYPVLVLDADNTDTLPKHFRHSAQNLSQTDTTISQSGLPQLYAAGSAQFSAKALTKVLEALKVKTMMVVDLRQESHGFNNGTAISWYGINNDQNLGKTPQQVENAQYTLLANLQNSTNPKMNVDQILTKDANTGLVLTTKPFPITIGNVYAEADLARTYNLGYTRIYVTDHMKPEDAQVDAFIALVKNTPAKTWLYLHCRGGKGRTTTFMAMLDMLRNAKQVPLDQILKRQYLLGGIDLTVIPAEDAVNSKNFKDRLEFMEQFYAYAKSNNDGFATNWSAWKEQLLSNAMEAEALKAAEAAAARAYQPPKINPPTTGPINSPPAVTGSPPPPPSAGTTDQPMPLGPATPSIIGPKTGPAAPATTPPTAVPLVPSPVAPIAPAAPAAASSNANVNSGTPLIAGPQGNTPQPMMIGPDNNPFAGQPAPGPNAAKVN